MSVTPAARSSGALAILGLRLTLALLFLTVWRANLHKSLYHAKPYAALIRSYARSGDAPGVWQSVMRLAADHAAVASKVQLVTELGFGLLLLLGLATRPVAAAAGLYLSSLWLSELGVPHLWEWSLVFPALVAFYLAIVSAGRPYGLDAVVLHRQPFARLPRWATGAGP